MTIIAINYGLKSFLKENFSFFLFSIPRWRKSKHKKQHLRELRSGFLDFQLRNCKLWISD